ncbi:LacI family DNA-binding transcriptional regulator [Metabacillus herbersteinensis]|uniref:LacI family DNA-binding transcriptional regulator n=1 Tax=Metabacillus herbersteinensis TaxID=283816 RepID=A0ABV6GAK9_9BACI
MNQKITIRDVARIAGVSSATVSYVINGVNKVSEETKARVLQTIAELNYQPDFTAISLSKKKSNMIGVMIPLVEGSLAPIFRENHYYSELISGIEFVSRKNGYDFLLSGFGKPEDCKNWVMKRNLDGLVFLGSFPESIYQELKALSMPIVLIDTYEEYAKHYTNIRIDDERGGYLATKHLIEYGHRSIGFVSPGPVNNPIDSLRLKGFQQALKEANLPFQDAFVFEGKDSSFENGYQIGKNIIKAELPITAIFAAADILALGIIKAFNEADKKVPIDYSVIGYDDLLVSRYASPSLTTISQDVFKKGAISAEMLISTIEKKETEFKTFCLPVELVIRDSTSRIQC